VPRVNRTDRQEYVWIPPGKFLMGCVPADQRCEETEKPRHPVAISKGFWLGATEVDVNAYQRYVEQDSRNRKMPTAPDWDRRRRITNHPITGASWQEAVDFCAWAGGRLPTEAEWEYAARAGRDGEIYPLNDENSREKANFIGTKGNDRFHNTAPVKSFDPNVWGLYDMAGNVWEWCSDLWDPGYYSKSPPVDPKGPAAGGDDQAEHVARGGSWYSDAQKHLRISIREHYSRGGNIVGFRCVLDNAPVTR
jgi:formylglycine-generating enzyme required for sulfatase activity